MNMLNSNTRFDKVDFNGGNLSSDGGAILLMKYLEKMNIMDSLREIPFNDKRYLPLYSNVMIMYQCLCRTLLGYHNQADQKVLIDDPLLCQFVSACSQPTVSRFFDRVSFKSCSSFREIVTKIACDHVNRNILDPILDADSTMVTTNGSQEGAAYIHHYSDVGLHPLILTEFHSKLILSPSEIPEDSSQSHPSCKTTLPVILYSIQTQGYISEILEQGVITVITQYPIFIHGSCKGSPKFLGETPKSLVETLGEKQ